MDNSLQKRKVKREKRAFRVRKHVRGTAEKPRLSVMKSLKHLSAQIIDDDKGVTLVSASTLTKEFRDKNVKKSKEGAKLLGLKLAALAKEKQISHVVFDRGRFKFHGLIAELANSAREAGLKF